MGTLFDKHPTKYPGYGNKKDVKAITREMLINYYNKYYSASNSIVSIVGKIGNTKKVIEKYILAILKTGELILEKNKVEELSKKPKVVKTKRKILNHTYCLAIKQQLEIMRMRMSWI
jgi:predicted Zn-dependent peptidase